MGIKTVSAVNTHQILFCTDPQVSVGVVVKADAGVAEDGKKVVKAGTPLSGDLTARTTPFVKAKDDSTGSAGDGKEATGVLLHDVDVTDGNANGTLLIFGFVNLDRLDNTTAGLITATRKKELGDRITFLK